MRVSVSDRPELHFVSIPFSSFQKTACFNQMKPKPKTHFKCICLTVFHCQLK